MSVYDQCYTYNFVIFMLDKIIIWIMIEENKLKDDFFLLIDWCVAQFFK